MGFSPICRINNGFLHCYGGHTDDDENDYVLQSSPCTFLNDDNTCFIYDYRPQACREYPHTDRKKMHQILNLTLENTTVCPAVSEIVDRIKN
mgnify:CR=1 FL=1